MENLLSNIQLPNFQSAKKLKPLSLSDVMVAFINQQKTTDRTAELKKHLISSSKDDCKNQQNGDVNSDDLILLPHFAQEQLSEVSLISYHLERQHYKNDQAWKNYENLLTGVEQKLNKVLQKYGQKIEESEKITAELKVKLSQAYQNVVKGRPKTKQILNHIKNTHFSISRKIRKRENIQKALYVMCMWSGTNLSKVLSIDVQKITQIQNVKELLQAFDETSRKLESDAKQLKASASDSQIDNSHMRVGYVNITNLITLRKSMIIDKIKENIMNSVIQFQSYDSYGKVYKQYEDILPFLSGEQIKNGHILTDKNLPIFIEKSINSVYDSILKNMSVMNNLEMLNEVQYIDFFSEVFEQFAYFFSSWHKITTFHINNATPFAQSLIRHRVNVASRINQKIATALKHSQKLMSICAASQIKLLQKLYDFIACSQEWMGKHKNSVTEMLRDKFKGEFSVNYKTNNSQLKNSLSEQLLIERAEDKELFSGNLNKSQALYIIELEAAVKKLEAGADLEKVHLLLDGNFEQRLPSDLAQSQKKSKIPLPQHNFKSKLCQKLVLVILSYLNREQFVVGSSNLSFVYDHYEFLLFIIYKVCLPAQTKQKLADHQGQKESKMLALKGFLAKGVAADDSLIIAVNDLRQVAQKQGKFKEITAFVSEIGDKFEGLTISSYVNISKLYQNYDKNAQAINRFNEKLILICEQLIYSLEYLQTLTPQFKLADKKVAKRIAGLVSLTLELLRLCLDNFYIIHSKKYLQTVIPPFSPLRWEIKKFANDTTLPFKQYKQKLLETYRQCSLLNFAKHPKIAKEIQNRQVQIFYKALLDLYSRIDKINDNGRQIIKLDYLELTRPIVGDEDKQEKEQKLTSQKLSPFSWSTWFRNYIQLTVERSSKAVIQKLQPLVLWYPVQCWKYSLMWTFNDMSSRQKKQFMNKILNLYTNSLGARQG